MAVNPSNLNKVLASQLEEILAASQLPDSKLEPPPYDNSSALIIKVALSQSTSGGNEGSTQYFMHCITTGKGVSSSSLEGHALGLQKNFTSESLPEFSEQIAAILQNMGVKLEPYEIPGLPPQMGQRIRSYRLISVGGNPFDDKAFERVSTTVAEVHETYVRTYALIPRSERRPETR